MKKFLALLCLITSIFILSVPVYAGTYNLTIGDFIYEIEDNKEAHIEEYIGTKTDLTIPSHVNGMPVTEILPNAFYTNVVTKVTIPSTITYLHMDAFISCSKLTSVTFEGAGLKTISTTAFSSCSSLKSIILPESLTALEHYAFEDCTSLEYVYLPASLTNIGNDIFTNCPKLKVAGPVDSGSNIEYAWKTEIPENAFRGYKQLTSVILPNTITKINKYAFSKCKNLTSISFPASLQVIETGAFSSCTSLTTLDLPDTIKQINYSAFTGCKNLTTVKLPKNLKYIGSSLFSGCKKLKSIELPSEYLKEIGENAFANCEALESIIIPSGVTTIGRCAFENCTNLSYVQIPKSVISIYMPFKNCPQLVTAGPIGGDFNIEYGWVTSIPKNAFDTHDKLKEILIPNTITSIGDNAFYRCSSLESVYFDGNANDWTKIEVNSPHHEIYNTNAYIYIMKYHLPFTDIYSNEYYYDAVDWAFLNGIVNGISETKFGPDDSCTRGQAVTFLWRTFGREVPVITNPFTDVPNNEYYKDPVLWAYQYGITTGTDKTHFTPDGKLTRAEFVTFLWRTQDEPEPTISNIFKDVPDDSYYRDAVLWAYENGITTGTDASHFNPSGLCTRAHVVTFLYRAFGEEVEEDAA